MHRFLILLASLKLTLVIIVGFAISLILFYQGHVSGTWILAVPLGLLAANLMAAVVTKQVFRRQRALLIFHLGLIAIIVLLAAGRLTYLRGSVEIAEGAGFRGELTAFESGPWHISALERIGFFNDGFSIAYDKGIQRGQTRNWVRHLDAGGLEQRSEIGDQTPLILEGYRFYTTPNKGFAPTFVWYPVGDGAPVMGAVHLPSYPLHEYSQARDWELPGTNIKAWTLLQFDDIILDPKVPSEFRLPNKYKIIMRIGELRRELQPGESIELPQGRLVFDSLRTWMGYTVFYDWTLHWLLVACTLAVLALAWHFWRKFAARPWNA